jgi:RimJ/RimL family protein N-acetyltransferase
MEIRLSRCTLRPWRDGDQRALARHANNRNVWIHLRDRFPHPYTEADAAAWISLASALPEDTQFAIEVQGEPVGGIGLDLGQDVHRRSAEVGYWLGEPCWGRGIATAALSAITELGFARFDLCRIYACVFDGNPGSVRVLEKAGYTFEGRLRKSVTKAGRTIDQVIYAIVRE